VLRRILPIILVLLMLMADCTVLPMLIAGDLVPLLTLVTVHCLGLLLGRSSGALYGLIAGLLLDISVSTPLGLMTSLYTGMGYLGGWFGRAMLNHPLAPVIASAICFTVFEFGMALYTIVAGAAFSSRLILHALIRIPMDIALTEGLYILYDWLIKPSRSRFAPR
jgi:rod shape-determining protein MreD